MPAAPALVWFREDLRTADHAALTAAAGSKRPVIPAYVLDTSPERRALGAASLWWLDKSLRAHADVLAQLKSRLILRRGPAVEAVLALVEQTGAGAVHWTRGVEVWARRQDDALCAALAERGVEAHPARGGFLCDPAAMRTKGGTPFKVYAAFRRAVQEEVGGRDPLPAPARLSAPKVWPASDDLDAWGLHPTKPDWSTGFADWTPGEAGAHARLDRFLREALATYGERRNIPSVEGSTRLSPHLRFGEITPDQIVAAERAAVAADPALAPAQDRLEFEVTWRDFHYHLLAHAPDMADRALRPLFEAFPFQKDAAALAAWRRGRTGYPIVDAGMNQLWITGWMHNRVRLITASFLVKHLLIDWREGERWFWDTLVDADPANNPASWQWVAGAGVDAAPYFRIFNPTLQGERFDPEGAYVKRWVPALARLDARYIHAPWKAPAAALKAAGVQLGRTYPRPIIDHAKARQRALAALRELNARRPPPPS